MAPTEWLVQYNSTPTANSNGLARGWVPQPNSRGTLDILESCLITIILCSWSILFLNVPAGHEGRWDIILTKARWIVFTIFFPEVVIGIAVEQWRSACQSVEDFTQFEEQWAANLESSQPSKGLSRTRTNLDRLRSSPWTMRHAFFADMGGFHIDCPDLRPFPVDGHQIAYLIENNHLEYPEIQPKAIWDRNKADIFARFLTLMQILWFLVQAIGRRAQHLAVSTIELTSLAFIFCTLIASFFFRHKPRDVETPFVLPCEATVAEILEIAGERSRKAYVETPLDFIKPPITRTSLVAPFWFGVRVCFEWKTNRDLPVKKFGNSKTTPPRGIKIVDIAYTTIINIAYFSIHLAGWNFVYPSKIEQVLWRTSSLTLLGLLLFYLAAVALGTMMASWLARTFFKNNEETTVLGVAGLLPRWAAIMVHGPVIGAYGLARCYILAEGFVNLRALPVTAFAMVDWSNFFPHFWPRTITLGDLLLVSWVVCRKGCSPCIVPTCPAAALRPTRISSYAIPPFIIRLFRRRLFWALPGNPKSTATQ